MCILSGDQKFITRYYVESNISLGMRARRAEAVRLVGDVEIVTEEIYG